MDVTQPLILASASPRRRELLSAMGLQFQVIVAETEEAMTGEPAALVMANARLKAEAVLKMYPGRMILGADTVVSIDGQVLGKPKDENDAFRMLKSLQGRQHPENRIVSSTIPRVNGTLRNWNDWNGNREKNGDF